MRFTLFFISFIFGMSSLHAMTPPSSAAVASISFETKTFRFNWNDVSDATYYQLLENPDGLSGYSQVGSTIMPSIQTFSHIVPLYERMNASYILQSCNSFGCTDGAPISITGSLSAAIGYFKPSTASFGFGNSFGRAISLSEDGNTLAVSAHNEGSNATGINGNQNNNAAAGSGAVYIFQRNSLGWQQQAYLKPSNTDAQDSFGFSLSLSANGNTLVVGATNEDSDAFLLNGDQTNNNATNSGAAYVFHRVGNTWSQTAYVKPTASFRYGAFGTSVSLSGDGQTLAVSALNDSLSGTVYVYQLSGSDWSLQSELIASNRFRYDQFGVKTSLSFNGNRLAVSAIGESSNAVGINGDQADNSALFAGAVYLFNRTGNLWTQDAYIKASNTDNFDSFGHAISLSNDGKALAVGAPQEGSSAVGINGDQTNNDRSGSGAVYLFIESATGWEQQAYIKASNTDQGDAFGHSVSLSQDGNILAVGATGEQSSANGLGGIQSDNSARRSGAAYVFKRVGTNWSQQAYLKASNTGVFDQFGGSIAISADGKTTVVGAYQEASNATGINGDQNNNSQPFAGAIYLY